MAMFRITQTMLDKSIQDADKEICRFLLEHDFLDYSKLTEKVYIPCKLQAFVGDPSKDSKISCYKTTRGDKRMWIKGIKDIAKAGDILNLKVYDNGGNIKSLIVQNLTMNYGENFNINSK